MNWKYTHFIFVRVPIGNGNRMKRVLLALYLMSAQMLVSAEQSSQYLKCEFCSPIPGLIKNETPRFLFDEIINLKQDFLNYDDSGLDTYQYRTSLATKSLTLLKSQHQINHTHLMYVNYLRAFPHSVPLGNEDDRTKFIAEFEEVFNFFPDSFIVDVRLMPTPFIVTPFIIVVNKVQSLSYQYQLSIDHEMELYRRTFRLMKTLLTARELLIEDFDLFHLEADTEKNRQYVADLLEIETVEHSHKMKQLEKRKLKVFLQELDSQQSLTPKLKKRLYRFYSEQIATTQAEIDDLWQQVQKNSEAFKKVIEGDDRNI